MPFNKMPPSRITDLYRAQPISNMFGREAAPLTAVLLRRHVKISINPVHQWRLYEIDRAVHACRALRRSDPALVRRPGAGGGRGKRGAGAFRCSMLLLETNSRGVSSHRTLLCWKNLCPSGEKCSASADGVAP